jgi:CO/xanthine dehydrogenase Mo-binding subunit
MPVFARDTIRYAGEAVGLLTGPDPFKLRDWARRCQVEVDAAEDRAGSLERRYHSGAVDAAFEKAEKIIGGTYLCHFQYPWPSDPPGAIAFPAKNGEVTVITATQWPSHVRESVAAVLALKQSQITVKPARLEEHLDSKLIFPSLLACQAAAAAGRLGRPVKVVLSRDEDFRYSPRRLKAEITLDTAIGGRGQPLASRVGVKADLGAYGLFGAELLDRIALSALGAYSHGSVAVTAAARTSALPPTGPAAGFGLAQGFFAAERHCSRIADALGEDPAEWRKNFFLHKGKKLAIGAEIRDSVPLAELLDTAASMSDYRRKWASCELLRQKRSEAPEHSTETAGRTSPQGHSSERAARPPEQRPGEIVRGIGISLAYQSNSLLYPPEGRGCGVEVTLNSDGSVEIKTGAGLTGEFPGKAAAAKILGVGEDRIRVAAGPDSGPACLSRTVTIITRLAERCCTAIRRQHFRDPLPITVRRFYHETKARAWDQTPCDENAFSSLSWGSAVVEAEFDPVTYLPRVRGIWLAVEAGTILSDENARRTLRRRTLQALSGAAREKIEYDGSGAAEPDTWLPEAGEQAPPVTIDFLWSDAPPRGIGDLPFTVIPSAYAQALSQALNYPFTSYPVTPRDIWNALSARKREGPP